MPVGCEAFSQDQSEPCIDIQRHELEILDVRRHQEMRDTEHETMIQGLSTRMDTISSELASLKSNMDTKFDKMDASVSKRLDTIEQRIPDLFKASMNEMLAKIAKWFLISIGALILVIVFAVTRPILIKALDELRDTVENTHIQP